ncbi:MAG: hypothetical protein ACYDBS_09045, partial [Acidimicrobiales bacterium]
DARFWPLYAALLLERPDTRAIQQIVEAILPEPYGGEIEIVTDAIIIAFSPYKAGRQAAEQRGVLAVPGIFLPPGRRYL